MDEQREKSSFAPEDSGAAAAQLEVAATCEAEKPPRGNALLGILGHCWEHLSARYHGFWRVPLQIFLSAGLAFLWGLLPAMAIDCARGAVLHALQR